MLGERAEVVGPAPALLREVRGKFRYHLLIKLAAGDVEAAAKTYMLVAILYDDDKYCSLALAKAAECYDSLGQKEQAIKVRAELTKRYPNAAAAQKAGA